MTIREWSRRRVAEIIRAWRANEISYGDAHARLVNEEVGADAANRMLLR